MLAEYLPPVHLGELNYLGLPQSLSLPEIIFSLFKRPQSLVTLPRLRAAERIVRQFAAVHRTLPRHQRRPTPCPSRRLRNRYRRRTRDQNATSGPDDPPQGTSRFLIPALSYRELTGVTEAANALHYAFQVRCNEFFDVFKRVDVANTGRRAGPLISVKETPTCRGTRARVRQA